MSEHVLRWLEEVWQVLVLSGPYLLLGFTIAGLLKVLVPQRWILRHLGGDDLAAVTKASLVGAPIPLCSCSVIPTAISLKEGGASKGATTSFLISTPETGVDSIGITWALMDPLMTLARPVAAVSTALASGVAVNVLVGRGLDGGAPAETQPGGETEAASCCHETAPAPPPEDRAREQDHAGDDQLVPREGSVVRRALGYAFGPLMADLTPWFIVGFALSALIAIAVPEDFFGSALPNGWPAMLVMLVAGVPTYICATASTPVAAALVAKGLDPGAALVLLLAGPATNVATIGVVSRFLGRRVLVVYLASIAVLSLACGWTVSALYPLLGLDPTTAAQGAGQHVPGALSQVAGGALLLLLAVHVFLRARGRSPARGGNAESG